MSPSEPGPLLALSLREGAGWIADARGRVALAELRAGSCLDQPRAALRGRSVLIAAAGQREAALAAIELDGLARRLVLCPPELDAAHLASVLREAAIDTVIGDDGRDWPVLAGCERIACRSEPIARRLDPGPAELGIATEWVLCTSGSTGQPKLVAHRLAGLLPAAGTAAIWGTFYDIRRFGGLAILLRALRGGSLVLSDAAEAPTAFEERAAAAGVTHLTGTPSHWRRALMSPTIGRLQLDYLRLSGEVADQALLDRLRATFPAARLVHAFASTEAGLAFEVTDGRAGFPAAWLDRTGSDSPVELRIAAGTLRVRSARTALGYLGGRVLHDAGGFVDTGDIIALDGDRGVFAGRREGVINVGGQKIYPEEIEAVIGRHPRVRGCRVWGRASPMMGAIVAADVVFDGAPDIEHAQAEVLAACRGALPAYKVPARLRAVAALDLSAAGKLRRVHA